jgi:uncharacterized membrane protein YtjA (UPF0391 family)
MLNYICTTCGTQFTETERPPEECAICLDERQYVGWNGQQWTTLDELRQSFLRLAILFLVLALVAAFFGFGGLAVAFADVAQILFLVFLVLFIVAALVGALRGLAPV